MNPQRGVSQLWTATGRRSVVHKGRLGFTQAAMRRASFLCSRRLPVWTGLELSESGVTASNREDRHEATPMEAGTKGL
jgi:hypothetical protein